MTEHVSSFQTFIESNLFNFAIFAGLLFWLLAKKLPDLAKQKNADIEAELKIAEDKCRVADAHLKKVEQKLQDFQNNLAGIKKESAEKLARLQADLEADKQEAIKKLQEKHEKEISSLQMSLKREVESKLVLRSVALAENLIATEKKDQMSDFLFQETIQAIQSNPQLLTGSK